MCPLHFLFLSQHCQELGFADFFYTQRAGLGQLAAGLQPHHQVCGLFGDIALGGPALSADELLGSLAAKSLQLAGDDVGRRGWARDPEQRVDVGKIGAGKREIDVGAGPGLRVERTLRGRLLRHEDVLHHRAAGVAEVGAARPVERQRHHRRGVGHVGELGSEMTEVRRARQHGGILEYVLRQLAGLARSSE